jgi:hypothetical protein
MGFGSYDESEQERQQQNTSSDEDDGINVHEHDHDGKVSVESNVSTDDLVSRLGEMRDEEEDDD